MWEAGMRELTLQKRLGHATVEATRLYTRVSDASVVAEYPSRARRRRCGGRMNSARLSSVADRAASPATAFQHCDDASTDAFLAGLPVTQGFRAMRRRYRRAFVERWPAIEDWFTAPFEERVGRLCGETQKRPGFPVSYRSRSHLYYLASIDRLRLDYHWLLAIGDLCVAPIADGLGLDLGIKKLAEQGVRHGYDRASIATSMTWVIPRITLHNGIWSVDDLRYSHIEALLDAIERFGDLHDVGKFRRLHYVGSQVVLAHQRPTASTLAFPPRTDQRVSGAPV